MHGIGLNRSVFAPTEPLEVKTHTFLTTLLDLNEVKENVVGTTLDSNWWSITTKNLMNKLKLANVINQLAIAGNGDNNVELFVSTKQVH